MAELLGIVLMASAPRHAEHLENLELAARIQNSDLAGKTISEIRRAYGLGDKSELEDAEYWSDTLPLSRALTEMSSVYENSFGTDILGDLFEYVLSKLSTAGQFGQFRTPAAVVNLMVEIGNPLDGELIADPACGTGGFLVAAAREMAERGTQGSYVGIEIDRTVARIARTNIAFHGMRDSKILLGDGLSEVIEPADLVLANPPFAGMADASHSLSLGLKTTKTELLFLSRILQLLKPEGRTLVVVPFGLLTGSGEAEKLRKSILEDHDLQAVIALPDGTFRPYTDVRTAILIIGRVSSPTSETTMISLRSLDKSKGAAQGVDKHLRNRNLESVLDDVVGAGDFDMCKVDHKTLKANRSNLNPLRYLPVLAAEVLSQGDVAKVRLSNLEQLESKSSDLARITGELKEILEKL